MGESFAQAFALRLRPLSRPMEWVVGHLENRLRAYDLLKSLSGRACTFH